MDPSYTQDLRNRPEEHPETPIDAILILDDGSRHPVQKDILAAQSDFFNGLFTFKDKMEYNITNPDIHQYLTKENFEMVLDTFYEIEPDFEEEKVLEMTILANYFLAPFLMKKCIRILVNDLGLDRKCFDLGFDPPMIKKQMKIIDLLEFAKQWSLEELHKAGLNGNLDKGMDLSDFLPFGQSEEMKSFQRADFEEFWRNANETQEISEEERKLFPNPPERMNSSNSIMADFVRSLDKIKAYLSWKKT